MWWLWRLFRLSQHRARSLQVLDEIEMEFVDEMGMDDEVLLSGGPAAAGSRCGPATDSLARSPHPRTQRHSPHRTASPALPWTQCFKLGRRPSSAVARAGGAEVAASWAHETL